MPVIYIYIYIIVYIATGSGSLALVPCSNQRAWSVLCNAQHRNASVYEMFTYKISPCDTVSVSGEVWAIVLQGASLGRLTYEGGLLLITESPADKYDRCSGHCPSHIPEPKCCLIAPTAAV